jgi:hypothetical protein
MEDGTGGWVTIELRDTNFLISTFGEDEDGEIYLADFRNGTIYRVVHKNNAMPWMPLLLED